MTPRYLVLSKSPKTGDCSRFLDEETGQEFLVSDQLLDAIAYHPTPTPNRGPTKGIPRPDLCGPRGPNKRTAGRKAILGY